MKTLAIVLAVIIIVLLGILFFYKSAQGPTVPSGPITSPDGHVTVTLPVANADVSSPLAIRGAVTGGGWFFEATFPVKILDANGNVIGQGLAEAQSDWMSTGTVPFSASIPFTQPQTATGTILFAKDNPSGSPANDESFSVPVVLATVSAEASSGTVQGKVFLSPTCAVEKNPPDPACAPKPYETSIAISTNIENPQNETFKTIASDASGLFSVSLPAGEYVFQANVGVTYPHCDQDLVEVSAGKTTTTTISCDTGIR